MTDEALSQSSCDLIGRIVEEPGSGQVLLPSSRRLHYIADVIVDALEDAGDRVEGRRMDPRP